MIRSIRRLTCAAAVPLALTACSGLLDVSDPTLVRDVDITNAQGANARRLAVVSLMDFSIGNGMRLSAFFSDERTQDRHPLRGMESYSYLDMRDGVGYEEHSSEQYLGSLYNIIAHADIALEAVRAYTPDSLRNEYVAHLHAMQAFTVVQMAEDLCPGFPINHIEDNEVVYGGPQTTESALAYAITLLDSAIVGATDSARILNFARVIKARALMDLGQWSEAAATTATVPDDFAYVTDPNYNGDLYVAPWSQSIYSVEAVGDYEGGNGMPFVSAQDPRVPTVFLRTATGRPADSLYDQMKYTARNTPIILASGLEARLIEAEAALAANDPAWLTILNDLRATEITPGMAPLADPGTPDAQLDLLYRERAFWLYLTGHRLGDLRRLVSRYGRSPETVFPTGGYSTGGVYGTATAIPFVLRDHAATNPNITTGCTTR